MGFTRTELESFRDVEVPDLLGDDLRLLFVGINSGLWTAAVQAHFARPGNRFYPALLQAGIITQPVAPSGGMTDRERAPAGPWARHHQPGPPRHGRRCRAHPCRAARGRGTAP